MNILVTGGAGFIGNHLVRLLLNAGHERVVVLDALTYAGSITNISDCLTDARCTFVHGNILDRGLLKSLLEQHSIDVVFHLAAETHVDRSITSALPFVETNVTGTLCVAEAIQTAAKHVRLIHVSTDEVYGSLAATEMPADEDRPLNPTSPYAASKASADLLIQSFIATHQADAIITRCCNNYGPKQYPEKLIPLMITRAFQGLDLPVYGNGRQSREWIFVEDHCTALMEIMMAGISGEIYNIGTGHEEENLCVVSRIVQLTGANTNQVVHVSDRPAHDQRYALNCSKVKLLSGWEPKTGFEEGLKRTIEWYRQTAVIEQGH